MYDLVRERFRKTCNGIYGYESLYCGFCTMQRYRPTIIWTFTTLTTKNTAAKTRLFLPAIHEMKDFELKRLITSILFILTVKFIAPSFWLTHLLHVLAGRLRIPELLTVPFSCTRIHMNNEVSSRMFVTWNHHIPGVADSHKGYTFFKGRHLI